MIKFGKALIFILCLNVASWIIAEGNLTRAGVIPINVTQKAQEINATIPYSQNPTTTDVLVGFLKMGWNIIVNGLMWIAFGFPRLLMLYNAPLLVYSPLMLIWAVITLMFVIEFLSGRNVTGD